jgi:hypothetical protein
MVPLREAHHPRDVHCNLVARKVRPNAELTLRLCAPYTARPPSQFAARQMVAIRRYFLLTQLKV